jgi:hypothetical protein
MEYQRYFGDAHLYTIFHSIICISRLNICVEIFVIRNSDFIIYQTVLFDPHIHKSQFPNIDAIQSILRF